MVLPLNTQHASNGAVALKIDLDSVPKAKSINSKCKNIFKSTPVDHLTDHPLNRLPEDHLMLNHDGSISLPRKSKQ